MNGYDGHKDDLQKRLRRIEGLAATKALETVALSLLSDHLSHCVAEASAEGGQVAADKIREANDAIARLVRS
ncbi:hypothetical protein LUZ63_024293 [Rhynchospora breviuscula]|uniref:Metal-sensing transcriptional repressor n=1 Tax=Rhynchospora breviuscula TaxID=2022672 RepID=A0A9P9Z1B9_9POAL|nr:hypothetical protein LUZ63_024293 [Rhynchospora breviuscula]